MRNLKITIQYNGSNYCGWQKQPDSLGIQGTIEKAIHDITREEVKLTGSGRTDAGVHALGQVANFKLENAIPVDKIPNALNSKLPKDISIIDCIEVLYIKIYLTMLSMILTLIKWSKSLNT